MKADAMEEFDDGEDFEIAFFAWMHREGIDNGISIPGNGYKQFYREWIFLVFFFKEFLAF